MTEKRYAIVRVECPPKNEIDAQFVCFPNDNNCSGCRYGDTKGQMIKKIVQVMLRRFKRMYNGKFITVEMAEKQYLEVAKEIVEFLGVEE